MKTSFFDRLAIAVFVVFTLLYLGLASLVSHDFTRNTFDVIQGVHVFDVDDTYRRFLVQQPFLSLGLWLWNFILPANLVFDGFFSWLTGHDEFFMRTSRLLVVLASLFLVFRAGRHIGIAAGWMLASCLILLCMPLFALISMSFYGEALLAAAMGLAIWAQATNREKALVTTLALFPFIRPEGFFFLVIMALKWGMERRFLSVFFVAFPGFIYFCLILYFFGSYDEFNAWRDALTSLYILTPPEESVMGHAMMPYYTVNPLWWIAGFASCWLPVLRRYRPFFIAAVMLSLYWARQSHLQVARGEARYLFVVFPLLALAVAAGADALTRRFSRHGRVWLARMICGLAMIFISVENFAQIDQVRSKLFADRRWPISGERGAVDYFYGESPRITDWKRETALFLEAYSKYDPSIKKIIIHAFPVFNELDVNHLPDGVSVEFSPMTPESVAGAYGGYFYSMFPELPQYHFYKFRYASQENRSGRYALYVGSLYDGSKPPLFANPYFQVYKVDYESLQSLPEAVFAAVSVGRHTKP